MDKFKNKYRIASHRKPNWDYSADALYFLTICTQNRECNLGEIINNEMILSDFGKIVETEWFKSFEIRRELILHEFVIMPNHLHTIVEIDNRLPVKAHGRVSQSTEITESEIVQTHVRVNLPIEIVQAHGRVSEITTPIEIVQAHGRVSEITTPIEIVQAHGRVSEITTPIEIVQAHGRVSEITTEIISDTHDRVNLPIKRNPPIRLPKSISSFIAGFKSAVNTKIDDFIDEQQLLIPKYNRNNHFFQPNYHDHIIRNEIEYRNISDYIINNPHNWNKDKFRK
ncbi:MAG: transposase [Arcicella sp.]|nr:transposase [Arcicella sp.]